MMQTADEILADLNDLVDALRRSPDPPAGYAAIMSPTKLRFIRSRLRLCSRLCTAPGAGCGVATSTASSQCPLGENGLSDGPRASS